MESNKTDINHDEIKDYYDTVYYSSPQQSATLSSHYQRLGDKLEICSGDTILDIACGTGSWLKAAEAKGAATFGVDISEKAIEACKANIPEGTFQCSIAESLPFENSKFDLVTCLGALEHFLDPTEALNEMNRVAKPEARFLLLVPNKDFLTLKLGLYSGTNQTDVKEELRTLAGWEELFKKSGLNVERKWRDLHILNWKWIKSGGLVQIPLRIFQALMLLIWPLKWQYQVYFLCRKSDEPNIA